MTYKLYPGPDYAILELDLGVARSEYEIPVQAYEIIRLYLDGECYISLHEPDSPKVDLRLISSISSQDKKIEWIYVTNSAQSGKKCILLLIRRKGISSVAGRIGAVQILDSLGNTVNPSTEDTLSDIKSKVDSIFNSLGDAGDSPSNVTGETVLKKLDVALLRLNYIQYALGYELAPVILTTTPLSANAEFTSVSKDIYKYRVGFVEVLATADADGTLYIEQSADNENWDWSESWSLSTDGKSGGAGYVLAVKCAIIARYVRVRFVNGGSDQSAFRLAWRFSIA